MPFRSGTAVGACADTSAGIPSAIMIAIRRRFMSSIIKSIATASTLELESSSIGQMEPTATSGLMATRECVEAADFEKVVQAYWPRIFRFVFASVRDEDAAENITQECFWRAHRAWSKFRGD